MMKAHVHHNLQTKKNNRMKFFNIKFRFIIALLILIAGQSTSLISQTTEATVSSPDLMTTSLVFIIVGSVMILFAAVIYVFSRYLHFLAKETVDRMKKNGSAIKAVLIFLFMSFSVQLFSQDAAVLPPAPTSGMTSSFLEWFIIAIMVVLLLLTLMLGVYVNRLTKAMYAKPEVAKEVESITESPLDKFLRWMNNAAPLHKEKDILLDHDYDGIKELDNSLPPWWLYGFYLCIIFAFCYMWYYHINHAGPSSKEEYEASLKEAQQEKLAMLGTQNEVIDENNVTLISDLSKLGSAKSTFTTVCAACHGTNGEGNIGPNLTDDYWLHGCSINEVFKTIKYGVPAKGMVAWEKSFSAQKIQELASYVLSLKGSKPANAKEPQGDLCEMANSKSDSTQVVIDSSNIK